MITPGILHNHRTNFCASIQNRRFCGLAVDIPQNPRYARAIKRENTTGQQAGKDNIYEKDVESYC